MKFFFETLQALDLLDKLLTLDPAKRIDSSTALDHDFFWTDPMPCDLSKMLSQHTQVRLLCYGHYIWYDMIIKDISIICKQNNLTDNTLPFFSSTEYV